VRASTEQKIRCKRKKPPKGKKDSSVTDAVKLDTIDTTALHKLNNAQSATRVVTTPKHTQ
jgi:hypothetical protein